MLLILRTASPQGPFADWMYHRYKIIYLLKVTGVEPLGYQQGEMGISTLEERRCDATYLPPYTGVSAKGFLLGSGRRNDFHLLDNVASSALHLRKLFHTKAFSDMTTLGATFCSLMDYFVFAQESLQSFFCPVMAKVTY